MSEGQATNSCGMRAILYARVSKDDTHNDDRNLNGQLDMCRDYAVSRGYIIVAELAEDDRGASGAEFDLEQLTHALEMARNGEVVCTCDARGWTVLPACLPSN